MNYKFLEVFVEFLENQWFGHCKFEYIGLKTAKIVAIWI